jgi:hypothetical protein
MDYLNRRDARPSSRKRWAYRNDGKQRIRSFLISRPAHIGWIILKNFGAHAGIFVAIVAGASAIVESARGAGIMGALGGDDIHCVHVSLASAAVKYLASSNQPTRSAPVFDSAIRRQLLRRDASHILSGSSSTPAKIDMAFAGSGRELIPLFRFGSVPVLMHPSDTGCVQLCAD